MNYRIIPPEERNKFPKKWDGFDLNGLIAGDSFLGCFKCGVQFEKNLTACSNQCPNCMGEFRLYTVGKNDLKDESIHFNDPELIAELKRREPEIRRQHFKKIDDINLSNIIIHHGEEKRFGKIIQPLYDLK